MSRNLCKTECDVCGSTVKLTGPTYLVDQWGAITIGASRRVADAQCTICRAKYTAWLSALQGESYGDRECDHRLIGEKGFFDLSYRSTFNDEPGKDDLPSGKIEVARVVMVDGRVAAWEPQI